MCAKVFLQIAECCEELHACLLVTLECLASMQALVGLQSEQMRTNTLKLHKNGFCRVLSKINIQNVECKHVFHFVITHFLSSFRCHRVIKISPEICRHFLFYIPSLNTRHEAHKHSIKLIGHKQCFIYNLRKPNPSNYKFKSKKITFTGKLQSYARRHKFAGKNTLSFFLRNHQKMWGRKCSTRKLVQLACLKERMQPHSPIECVVCLLTAGHSALEWFLLRVNSYVDLETVRCEERLATTTLLTHKRVLA